MIADKAVELGAANGLGVEVFNKDQLTAMGCGGMVGVNTGSAEPPRMVRLTYTPRNPRGHLVLVGKGVMFDSGGLSLKTNDGMHDDEDGHERRRRGAGGDDGAARR